MTSLDTQEINPQISSPLFSRLPSEIRLKIFSLASTTVYDKSNTRSRTKASTQTRPKNNVYPKKAFYYRPNFRYAHSIPTTLPLVCRRIYLESHTLLPTQNTHTEWHAQSRGPFSYTAAMATHPSMTTAHLFLQQCHLESWHGIASRLERTFDGLRELTITIRHSDWWWWESSAPLALDPKRRGKPDALQFSKSTDGFAKGSWGEVFAQFNHLRRFNLELETREGKKAELDAIVGRAGGWRFPLGDVEGEGMELVLEEERTGRRGWAGLKLPSGRHFADDPVAAKQRLVAAGVNFRVEDAEPEIERSAEEVVVYYVVTLRWCRRRVEGDR